MDLSRGLENFEVSESLPSYLSHRSGHERITVAQEGDHWGAGRK